MQFVGNSSPVFAGTGIWDGDKMCHKDARPNCAIKKEKGDEMYYGKTIQFEDVNASDVGEDFSVSLEYKYPAGTNITI